MPRCPEYDVAILGGGPGGMALALALAGYGNLSIVVIERSGYDTFRGGETVSPEARRFLGELGIWDAFLADGHLPSAGSCSSWGSAELSYRDHHLSHPWGVGWHLDRRRFDRTLAREAEGSGVTVLRSTHCRRALPAKPRGYELELVATLTGRGSKISCRFAVDATGRRSAFARRRGARHLVADRLVGIHGLFQVRPGQTFGSFTLVESRPEGWWFSALLPDERAVVVLMTDAHAVSHGAATAEAWQALVDRTSTTRQRLQACLPACEPLGVRPADVYRASVVASDDWLSVGDAASAFDPLSSRGIVKALGGAVAAARAITRRLDGDRSALGTYSAAVEQQFEKHLALRKVYYDLETRWGGAPFWSRRNHARPAHTSRSLVR